MRKACFTEHQIIAVIKSVETGRTVKVDDFNRETLSIKIILNLPDLRMIRVLDRIAANCGYPIMLHMNNGLEFISLILAEWAEKHAVKRDLIQPGKPTQDTFIEYFNRTYRTYAIFIYS